MLVLLTYCYYYDAFNFITLIFPNVVQLARDRRVRVVCVYASAYV